MGLMKLSSKFKTGLIIILLIVFFIVLNLPNFSKRVKDLFYLISSPIQKSLWEVGDRTSDFFEAITETKSLKKENEELKLRIQELLVENISLKELKKENENLKEALSVGLEKDFKLILTEVIGKDIAQDSILINKGSEAGVSKNLPVITQQKVLVGKVSEVYKNFSKVMLISNKESSFNAKIENNEEIEGVIDGQGGFQLLLKLILLDKKISEGEMVISSSLGGIFPEGLLVGEIKKVLRSDVESLQEAQIKPAFDIKEIKNLFIITEF